jgi:hypothetical protein
LEKIAFLEMRVKEQFDEKREDTEKFVEIMSQSKEIFKSLFGKDSGKSSGYLDTSLNTTLSSTTSQL